MIVLYGDTPFTTITLFEEDMIGNLEQQMSPGVDSCLA